jgi:DNA repair protein RadA/Sms
MARPKTIYTCQSCGYQSPKWLGKCPDCNQWNTLVEEIVQKEPEVKSLYSLGERSRPGPISEIATDEQDRQRTGIAELDRVLGGGIVLGSVVLIGGDPGIGKSTLILQALNKLGEAGCEVLYVSGEESARQIRLRADRLCVGSPNLLIATENSLDRILEDVGRLKPKVLVVDSIQTVFSMELQSAPGSISQVREATARLMQLAKTSGVSTFLIGHVTKEGAIAGPRVLEHMVDTVLYFEGDKGHPFRILRAVKNRFGSTNEIGVFEMKTSGLEEVINPSELFLAERPLDVPGSVVVSSLEGSRPILVELQALVSPASFGVPRRTTIGVDYNRVSLLIAVLEKKAGLNLPGQDIFVNVAGGVRIEEPGVDLGIVSAIASSFLDKPISSRTMVVGEVGLAGEVRGVSQVEIRIKEAVKLGFELCLLPKNNLERLHEKLAMELIGVGTVSEALDKILP